MPREITINTMINSSNHTIRHFYSDSNQTPRTTPIKRKRVRKLVANDAAFVPSWNNSSLNYCQQTVFPQSLSHAVIVFCEPPKIISNDRSDKISSGNGEDNEVLTLLRSSKTTRFGSSLFSGTAR